MTEQVFYHEHVFGVKIVRFGLFGSWLDKLLGRDSAEDEADEGPLGGRDRHRPRRRRLPRRRPLAPGAHERQDVAQRRLIALGRVDVEGRQRKHYLVELLNELGRVGMNRRSRRNLVSSSGNSCSRDSDVRTTADDADGGLLRER
jgi:hypothetical protein